MTKRVDDEKAALLLADQEVAARLLWARALFEKNYAAVEGET